jgi:hypothetical protein
VTRGINILDDGRDPDCPERHEQQRDRRERGATS